MEPRPQTDGAEGQTDVLGGVGEWGGEVYRGNEGGDVGTAGGWGPVCKGYGAGGKGHVYRGCGGEEDKGT